MPRRPQGVAFGGLGRDVLHTPHYLYLPCPPQLLGKKEFKALLKWRLALRQSFPEALRPLRDTPGGADAGGDDDDNEIDDDEEGSEDGEGEEEEEEEAELRELSAEAAAELRRRKREGKRDAKRKAKSLQRQRLGMNLRNVDLLDTELNLFSLTGIRRLAGAAGRGGGADAALESVINVNLDDDGALGGVELALLAADVRAKGGEKRAQENAPPYSPTCVSLPAQGVAVEDAQDDRSVGSGGEAAAADEAAGLDGTSAAPLVLGEGSTLEQIRARDAASRMDDLDAELDQAYAVFLAKREKRDHEHRERVEAGANPSHGIRLGRRRKLEQQALLTQQALEGRLDAEHQKYLQLLTGVRK